MAFIPGQSPLTSTLSVTVASVGGIPAYREDKSCHILLTADQSPGPFKSRITEPPSNVILDDRAVYDILESNIPRAQLSKRWSHDFSGQANVRHRRAHRGRPAYKDENGISEKDKYHSFKPTGKNAPLYYFSGEKEFEPTFYHDLPEQPAEASDSDDAPTKPRQHNQYTAPELLVRNGAQSASLTKGKYRPRVNTFLRRSPSPPWVQDRKRLFGGVGIGRPGADVTGNASSSVRFDFSFAAAPAPDLTATPAHGESMWVEQDDENELYRSGDEEVMPSVFDRPAPTPTPTPASGNAATAGDEEEATAESTSTAPQKRQAPTEQVSVRRKVPRQMGYIERLAAGLLQEDAETTAVASEHANDASVAASSDQNRIAQLEYELQVANITLAEQNARIEALKLELENLHDMMA